MTYADAPPSGGRLCTLCEWKYAHVVEWIRSADEPNIVYRVFEREWQLGPNGVQIWVIPGRPVTTQTVAGVGGTSRYATANSTTGTVEKVEARR